MPRGFKDHADTDRVMQLYRDGELQPNACATWHYGGRHRCAERHHQGGADCLSASAENACANRQRRTSTVKASSMACTDERCDASFRRQRTVWDGYLL